MLQIGKNTQPPPFKKYILWQGYWFISNLLFMKVTTIRNMTFQKLTLKRTGGRTNKNHPKPTAPLVKYLTHTIAQLEPVIMRPQAPSVHTKVQHRPVSRRIQVKKLLLFSSEVRHETGGCGDKAVGRGVWDFPLYTCIAWFWVNKHILLLKFVRQ